MSLNIPQFSSELQALLGPTQDVQDADKLKDVCDALAEAIVTHFQDNAVVVMKNGGVDSNGDSLSTNEGDIT